jgi:hypothetical protein
MKIFSSKKRVAAIGAVTAATLVGGGVAFAYWTNGGAGTGTAQTGTTTDNLTITASAASDLFPGGPAEELALVVDNTLNPTYSVQLTGLDVSIDSVTCNGTSVPGAWFTLGETEIDSATIVAPGAVTPLSTPTGVTLRMNNDPLLNQNVCKDAAVAFNLTVG